LSTTLITAGVACIIAAIIGGGLKAFGIEIPLLQSKKRQVLLGILGIILIGLSISTSSQNAEQSSHGSIGSGHPHHK